MDKRAFLSGIKGTFQWRAAIGRRENASGRYAGAVLFHMPATVLKY